MTLPLSTRPRRVVAIMAIGALFPLTACGESLDAAPSAGSSSASPDVAEVPELAAMVPDAIAKSGVLEVATAVYPPAVMNPSGSSELTGYDVETVRATAAALGLEARFTLVKFDAIIPGLEAGRYQAAAGEIAITDERAEVVTFVQNHVSNLSLLVDEGKEVAVSQPTDLCGLSLSAQLGSNAANFLTGLAKTCLREGKDALELQTFQDQATANLAVAEGRVDAGVGGSSQVAYVVDQSDGRFSQVVLEGGPESGIGLALPRNEDTQELAEAIVAATDHLIEEGVIQDILDDLNGGVGAVDNATIVPQEAA